MRYLFLIIFSIAGFSASAQGLIRGQFADTSGSTIPGVSVVLLSDNDSTIEAFANSDAEGKFKLKNISSGKYILKAQLIGFKSITKNLELSGNETDKDIGKLVLQQKTLQLKEVNVEAEHVPVKLSGDTVEYNAKAFKTQPNAMVEDLLKKMPGIEVDKDGSIKAHGKTVNKVLVDGKEFFGDDPKMATKNLPADAVNQVQVFDKKSEMADFTGVDDGVRDKTINLKLKEDKKKGTFGNIAGGYGTQDRYESRANISRFDKKNQFSLLATSNNTNQQGFSIMDYVNFMGGMKSLMADQNSSGGGRISLNPEETGVPISYNSNDGFTRTHMGGINMNHDFADKSEIRASWFVNEVNKQQDRTIFRQNVNSKGGFSSTDQSFTEADNLNNRGNLIIRKKVDSTGIYILKSNVSLYHETKSSASSGISIPTDQSGNVSSAGSTYIGNTGVRMNNSLNYLHKFRKKGRNFGVEGGLNFRNYKSNTDIYTFRTLSGLPADTINQHQQLRNDQLTISGKMSYTEPLTIDKFLEINYNIQRSDNKLNKDISDLIHQEKQVNNLFSNSFLYQKAGASFKWAGQNFYFVGGIGYQFSELTARQNENESITRNFRNWMPRISYNYKFGSTKSLQYLYQTTVNEPSADQLQPVINNTDPTNIIIGNPDLSAEYSHNNTISFNYFDQFSFTSLFASISGNYTLNKIGYERNINKLLVSTSRPVNLDHDFYTSGYISFNRPFRPLGVKYNISGNILYNKGLQLLNGELDNIDRIVNTADFSIENRNKENFDIKTGIRLTWNHLNYAIHSEQNQNILDKTLYTDFFIYYPKKWTLYTGLDYVMYGSSNNSSQQKVPLWKASVSRKFLKTEKGEIKFSVIDIFNQNIGIKHSTSFNYIQEERIRSLGKYFMLSLIYSI